MAAAQKASHAQGLMNGTLASVSAAVCTFITWRSACASVYLPCLWELLLCLCQDTCLLLQAHCCSEDVIAVSESTAPALPPDDWPCTVCSGPYGLLLLHANMITCMVSCMLNLYITALQPSLAFNCTTAMCHSYFHNSSPPFHSPPNPLPPPPCPWPDRYRHRLKEMLLVQP